MQSKSILITGATGFLGSALCRNLLTNDSYSRVVVFSRDWHKQSALRTELSNPNKFRWFIGDIRDRDRLITALNGIEEVVHAASIKDQLSSAYNPIETKRTNIDGTENVIEAAIARNVHKVLFISSDKATFPISAYGISKAYGEALITAANAYSPHGTLFSALRYGNVVGSSSSVIPLFKAQKQSGKLIVTHQKMTRFWVKIEDVIELVFKALSEMCGGEVFIPKLSSSTILDLAKTIAPNAIIEYVDRNVSEKIHEIMVNEIEASRTQDVGWAYRISPEFKFWDTATNYPSGSPVPWGWVYSSASAPRLTQEQLQEMVK